MALQAIGQLQNAHPAASKYATYTFFYYTSYWNVN
jgi:hypothetical protein